MSELLLTGFIGGLTGGGIVALFAPAAKVTFSACGKALQRRKMELAAKRKAKCG